MSKRYFTNTFSDYENQELDINKEFWTSFLAQKAIECLASTKLNLKTCDGGLYVGNLGLVYMIHKLLTSNYLKKDEIQLKTHIKAIIELNKQYFDSNASKIELASFLLGRVGFLTISSIVHKDLFEDDEMCLISVDELKKSTSMCDKLAYLHAGSDEMFVGRAGVLTSFLYLKKNIHIEALEENHLHRILDALVASGRCYAAKYGDHSLDCPLMYSYHGKEYLGAAHGMSAIFQILLMFPSYLKLKKDVEIDVRKCVDFLLSTQYEDGNFPSSTERIGNPRKHEDQLIHWCHGASGVIYCMAKAYMYWGEEKYLKSCLKSADLVWNYGLLKKGPGICHGIAGNGYVHLLMYRLTSDKKYLYRASKFAEFLLDDRFINEARTPDSPFSLYEGYAGTVCFLVDLLSPENATFPFFDIFD